MAVEPSGEAEVNEFDVRVFALVGHQEVLRLEVSVHEAVRVQVLNCVEHLPQNFAGRLFTELLDLYNAIEQLATRAVLHYNVHVPVVNVGLVEFYNVWMVKLLQDRQLFLQKLDVLLDVLPEDRFDGVQMAGVVFVMGLTHSSKLASAEHFLEKIDFAHILLAKGLLQMSERVSGSAEILRFSTSCFRVVDHLSSILLIKIISK